MMKQCRSAEMSWHTSPAETMFVWFRTRQKSHHQDFVYFYKTVQSWNLFIGPKCSCFARLVHQSADSFIHIDVRQTVRLVDEEQPTC